MNMFDPLLKWTRAVWMESNNTLYSDTVLTSWIDIENRFLYWPKFGPKEKAFRNQPVPNKTFMKYPLIKIKIQSGK